MPFLMLKSTKHSCPECNPNKEKNGIWLFHVDGDGKIFFFCGNCLGEFILEDERIIQTKKMEKEIDVESIFVKANGYHCEKSANPELLIPQVETEENIILPEPENQIDK